MMERQALKAIKQGGGLAIAQDPKDALYADMPRSAIDAVPVDSHRSTRNYSESLDAPV